MSQKSSSKRIPRKKKDPVWVWRFRQSAQVLQTALQILQDYPNPSPTTALLLKLGIELRGLSFESGKTSNSQTFFTPRTDGTCKTENSRLIPLPGIDDFMTFRAMRRAGIHKEFGLQPYLASAFKAYAYDLYLGGEWGADWKPVSSGLPSREMFFSRPGNPYFTVFRGMQSTNTHQCHRLVWMQSDDETRDDYPSVAELAVLTSWMLGSMYQQKYQQKRNKQVCTQKPYSSQHHVFPTLILSFQPRARVRILHGYYDGTLKIHFSKAQEFDVPNYIERMDCLLQWAWPVLSGRTTTVVPLPTISESDEEQIEEKPEKPHTRRLFLCRSKRRRVKRTLVSLANGVLCVSKSMQSMLSGKEDRESTRQRKRVMEVERGTK